jgi:hypothetical protein
VETDINSIMEENIYLQYCFVLNGLLNVLQSNGIGFGLRELFALKKKMNELNHII